MEMEAKVVDVKVHVVSERDRYAKMEQDIKFFGNKVREKITLMENKLLDKLKESSGKHIKQMTADIEFCEITAEMYQQQAELIDQALQSGCDMDVYEMYHGFEAGDVDAVGDVDVKDKGRISRIMLRQNEDGLIFALDTLPLGEIDIQYDGMLNLDAAPVSQDTGNVLGLEAAPVSQDTGNALGLEAAPVSKDTCNVLDPKAAPVSQDTCNVLGLEATPALQDTGNVLDLKAAGVLPDTINVGAARDRHKKYGFDSVAVLMVNGTRTVVLTDCDNGRVTSYYTTNNQRRHSSLTLGVRTKPWGIPRLKHNQVAVTLPDTKRIETIWVKPDLVRLTTIKTSKEYWGIASLTPSTLAAGAYRCVDILDMTGNVLRTMNPIDRRKGIIRSPRFLCTTRTGNILVSDGSSRRVVCLTAERDVVFTYPTPGHKTLGLPRGIISTSTGDILVTDFTQHTVVHLTESGQFVRNILTGDDGIRHPRGVCVDERGRVYVCNSGEIKVFAFSNAV